MLSLSVCLIHEDFQIDQQRECGFNSVRSSILSSSSIDEIISLMSDMGIEIAGPTADLNHIRQIALTELDDYETEMLTKKVRSDDEQFSVNSHPMKTFGSGKPSLKRSMR